MNRKAMALVLLSLFAMLGETSARAQSGSPGGNSPTPARRAEISPFGGYVWTTSREVYYNRGGSWTRLDIKDSGFWGVALDVNLPSGRTQVELLYQRQDSQMTHEDTGYGTRKLSDMAVEYYQIGGLRGVRRGKVMGFGGYTLGATHLIYDDKRFENDWKFSMIFSLGAKAYVNDRFGLRVQGRLPFTLSKAGSGLGCGPNDCYSTVGGAGVGQIDVSAGLLILI